MSARRANRNMRTSISLSSARAWVLTSPLREPTHTWASSRFLDPYFGSICMFGKGSEAAQCEESRVIHVCIYTVHIYVSQTQKSS